MNEQERRDLIDLVDQDQIHIEKFLQYHNLAMKYNEFELLYSAGSIDSIESNLKSILQCKKEFTNLWELDEMEPHIVWCSFTLQDTKISKVELNRIMKILSNKITSREGLQLPTTNLGNSNDTPTTCPHFQSINIVPKQNEFDIILIGAICLCS